MASQIERRAITRSALIDAARACFAEQGLEATSLEAILARAGLSKGALYHHFDSRTDLIAAVFETVTRETLEKAQTAAQQVLGPREALAAGLKAWLRAVIAPEPAMIVLGSGPAALGLTRARAIEDAIMLEPVRIAVAAIVEPGQAQTIDIDLIARVLNAAVGEMALTAVARGPTTAMLEQLDRQIVTLIAALIP